MKTLSSVESNGQDRKQCGFKWARHEAVWIQIGKTGSSVDSKSQDLKQCGAKRGMHEAVWIQNGKV